jgi:hypothetical protein
MRQRIIVFMWAAALMLGAAPVLHAEDASFGKDLKATIALQGMPCDQVINAKRNADSDYTASCKDGNRYHVFVSPEGRVVVKKL